MKTNILILSFFIGLVGCGVENEDTISLSLKNYYDSSLVQTAIMGYITQSGDMKYYSFGPSLLNKEDTVGIDNIF